MRGYQQILKLFDAWDEREEEIPFGDLVASLKSLELERADLANALIFADRNYRRIAVRRRPHYEALVLCWKSGQRSPIHNHLGSSCVVRVVEGRATETQYVFSPCGRLVPRRSRTYAAGSVTGCRDEAIHQMANLEAPGEDLITLHVYSPPPSSWNYFKLDVTTLADHDVLLSEGNQTVVVDFGQIARETDRRSLMALSTTPTSTDSGPVIAIVGGGFSGTMIAVHLARLSAARSPHVRLFEKSERPARGLAYGTRCEQHLLNVTAGLMSALPDEPTHFLDWLRARDPSAHSGTFAPRRVYGDYLAELLAASTTHSNARIDVARDEVVDLELVDGTKPVRLTTHTGNVIEADQVVLALGNPLPGQPQGLDGHGLGRGYVADPWSAGVLEGLEPDDAFALIGSGLTAVDLIVEAHARGHRGNIVTISRHGLFPCRHQTSAGNSASAHRDRSGFNGNREGFAQARAVGGGCVSDPGERLAIRRGFDSTCHANAVAFPGRRGTSTVCATFGATMGCSSAPRCATDRRDATGQAAIGTFDRRRGSGCVAGGT